VRYAYIDCSDSVAERVLYARILAQLKPDTDSTSPAVAARSIEAVVAQATAPLDPTADTKSTHAFRDRMSEFVVRFRALTAPFESLRAASASISTSASGSPSAAAAASASAPSSAATNSPAIWEAPPPPVYLVFENIQVLCSACIV
jgi:hypothetical protein